MGYNSTPSVKQTNHPISSKAGDLRELPASIFLEWSIGLRAVVPWQCDPGASGDLAG